MFENLKGNQKLDTSAKFDIKMFHPHVHIEGQLIEEVF